MLADSARRSSGFQLPAGGPQAYDDHAAPLMAPFVAALVDEVVRTGDDLLDVACGTGFVTRAAAAVTGPDGSLTAVDVNSAMVEFAVRQLLDRGLRVEARAASALDIPFREASFDTVTCQQGVQFFPDPVAGLVEMRRVTRPGGRLGLTVWAPIDNSPYLQAQLRLLVGHANVDPSAMSGAFPAAGGDGLHEWAARAGWRGIEVTTLTPVVALPPLVDYIPAHLRALPWSAPFFDLPAAQQAAAVDEMIESLSGYVLDDGSAAVPTASLLLTATAD